MNTVKTTLAAATLALGFTATPAMAQAQGIAVINEPVALAGVTALQTAYNQITQQYGTQIQSLQQLGQQRNDLLRQLDTNGDGNLDDAEQQAAANAPQAQQIAQIDQQAAGIENQINRARAYAVEQVLQQFGPTLQQMIADRQIQILLPSDQVVFANPAASITQAMSQALSARITTVNTNVPQDWQPASRQVVTVMDQVSQVYAIAQAQQQAQQQQQQQQPAQQPQGR